MHRLKAVLKGDMERDIKAEGEWRELVIQGLS